jgi:hypothetical protein
MRTTLILCLFALGCGDDGGGGGGGSADAATAPAMITISGTATKREGTSSSPAAGVMVGAYKNSDPATAVATATTDAAGMYSMMITTGGTAVDGYLKATLTGFLDTYLYPPKPLSENFDRASLNIVNQSTLDLLSGTLCGTLQEGTKGLVAVLVVDAANAPVAGATITGAPAPAKYCYNSGGFPNKNATMTDTDGIAYMINLPPGEVTVSATKSGTTFVSHKVNARAGTLTTTPIQP